MIEIIPIDTPTLGDRSYLVTDGEVCFAVDPQRDIDRVLALARGRAITHVFETHIHNDYVTGGLALAHATGAAYHVNAADRVSFEHQAVADGEIIEVGPRMRVRVLSTPGHTRTHLSYVLESPDRPPAVFTGGSLLYGSTGRPDLLGPAHTHGLVHAQYGSAHRLAGELPDDTEIFPTHGFGSFCSATQSEGDASTIGREKHVNPVFILDEDGYVEALLAGLDAYPAYYAHMGPANSAGPDAPDLSPPRRAEAAELRRRIEAGEWIVDLRSRSAFAAGHLAGAYNFGLDEAFATYLGWLIPWGTPVTLLGETAQDVATAQRELVRIGIDRPAASATGGPADWSGDAAPSTLRTATFAELTHRLRAEGGPGDATVSAAQGTGRPPSKGTVRHHRAVTVLDVRRVQEWNSSHIAGAVHIPLHELPRRMEELPDGEVWVHCQAGYRASIAASILAVGGRRVVAIDDEYRPESVAGLSLVSVAA